MAELTVGYVSGIIALGVFVVQLICPTLFAFIVAGILNDKESAATWTSVAPLLQHSYWTQILRSDVARSGAVRSLVAFPVYATTVVAALTAIAGVVTPLGLYEAESVSQNEVTKFEYVLDPSPFGVAKLPQTNHSWSRKCSQGHGLAAQGPAPCPYTQDIVITNSNVSVIDYQLPYGYDIKVPQIVLDIYGSGTKLPTTVSNFFDIRWRRYGSTIERQVNNGTRFDVGDFEQVDALALRDRLEAIEGLIVDTKTGGIGFRNHTVPAASALGYVWTEDILFIEPSTICVNTNLTLNYSIRSIENVAGSSSSPFSNVTLVDLGGFVNMNQTYPTYNRDNSQRDPDLRGRAYKAAWLNNWFTMLYMNITDPGVNGTDDKSFTYMNSFYGKAFPLSDIGGTINYQLFGLSTEYGSYIDSLPISEFSNASASVYAPPGAIEYANPFKISSDNFSSAGILCSGAGGTDLANITNIFVHCGLMRGASLRTDGGSRVLAEGGSKWSSPIYSCASALQAKVKEVTLKLNGTSRLDNLQVSSTRDKEYRDEALAPLWAVEDTGLAVDGISPVWGLVDHAYEKFPNISFIQKPSLYLPGWNDPTVGTTFVSSGVTYQNLPGTDFGPWAMGSVYTSGLYAQDGSSPTIDYSGASNIAMKLRWQDLSASVDNASSIINLIWTDLAANAVVGTKGSLGPENNGMANETVGISVGQIQKRIRYHIPYGIPAFILFFLVVLIILTSIISAILGRSNHRLVKRRLNQTSVGRLFTTVLHPQESRLDMPSKEWNDVNGATEVNLSNEGQIWSLGYSGVNASEHEQNGSSENQDETGKRPEMEIRDPSSSAETERSRLRQQ